MSSVFRATKVDIKSTSDAAWWIKNPSQPGTQRQRAANKRQARGSSTSLCHELADLLRNISLHGYSKLLAPELLIWERLIWLAVHVTTFICLLIVLLWSWQNFIAKYVVIYLHDPRYPVENVPFPAISICSSNRISRQAATLYAYKLSRRDPEKRTMEFFLKLIKGLDNLYPKFESGTDYHDYEMFQKFLDIYDTKGNETFYNTREKMKDLTPKCNHIIKYCSLAGVAIDCFSQKAFQDSFTMYGTCCTFNLHDSYRQRNDRFVNAALGLTVFLNTSRADDLASILCSDGYIVIVHNPNEFPFVGSGGAQEIFPTRNEESFISINPRIVDTHEALRSFSPKMRKCYFDNEAPDWEMIFKDDYTFSNCITRCRIQSILALCRCMPFYFPLTLANNQNGVVYCTIAHLSCLQRYNFKWQSVLTHRELLPGLERENEEALFCPQCLPSCVDVQYQVSLSSLPIDRYRNSSVLKHLNGDSLKLEDISLVRIHFDEPYAKYYRRAVGNSWFEVLCTVGNVTSIILGFSIVAVFEIAYFLVRSVIIGTVAFLRENAVANTVAVKKSDKAELVERGLYICP